MHINGVRASFESVNPGSQSSVVLNDLDYLPIEGQTATVSYTDPTIGDDDVAVQDTQGDDAPSFAGFPVTIPSTLIDPAPFPVSATVPAGGDIVDIAFNRALDDGAGRTPAASQFTVTAAGTNRAVTGVEVIGSERRVRLTLSTPVEAGQVVRVSYADPSADDDTAALQSVAGVDAPSFTEYEANNRVPVAPPPPDDSTPTGPTPALATVTVGGNRVDIVFRVLLDDRAGRTPAASQFTATVDGTDVAVTGVEVSGSAGVVRLTLSTSVNSGQTVTVSYADPSAGDDPSAVQNPNGADAPSFADFPVSVLSAGGPVLESAVVRAERNGIELRFDRAIDVDAFPPTSAFVVVVDGSTVSVDEVIDLGELGTSVPSASLVYLTTLVLFFEELLPDSITTATVSYIDPTSGDDARAIQDTAGVDAASFAATAVIRPFDFARGAPSEPLTATFRDVPTRHGGEAFTFELAFSEAVAADAATLEQALRVTGGSVTEVAPAAPPDTREWAITVTPGDAATDVTIGVAPNSDCEAAGAICTAAGGGIEVGAVSFVPGRAPPALEEASVSADALVLRYSEALDEASVPGAAAFAVTVDGEARALAAADAVAVSGQAVTLTLASAATWGQTVAVRYTAPAENPLQDPSGNRVASGTAEAVVAEVKLTVGFEEGGLPEEHDGVHPLVFRIAFSEQPWSGFNGQWLSATLRSGALLIRLGGRLIRPSMLEKLDNPGRARWEITVPHSPSNADKANEDFTIALGPTRDCADKDAVCTADRRKLSNRISAVVRGPSVMSVAGAQASEAAAATLDFAVTLSRALRQAVTVAYATSAGTAVAGEDYTETSGTLTFEAGETEKTVSVPVLDDAEAEGLETVVLTLSAVSGGNARLVGESATGTIEDDEGLQPLTARFWDPPAHHTGEAFTFELEFSEEVAVSAETLRDHAFTVTGGSVTAAEKLVAESNRNWAITVTPASAAEAVTVALAPRESCEDEGALCTADGRGLAERVEGTVAGPAAAVRVTSASVTSEPGTNGAWDTGETVEAEVRFSDTVTVTGPQDARPTLGITLDGMRREAVYTGGSGTDTLTFSHTVAAGDDGARRARVAANGLSLNGTVIGDDGGREAELGFATAPWVTAVALAPDASGDGAWTSGESIEVHLTFNEAVTVAHGTPTVGVSAGGGAATLGYASGSGSATLVFSRAVTETDGSLSQIAVTADRLALNGASVVSAASGLAAELAHDGTEPTAAPGTGVATPLTAAFHDLPDAHGGAAFAFRLRFGEEIPLSYRTLRDAAFEVANGAVSAVRRATPGESRAWDVTVTPQSGAGDVTVTLPATADCAAAGAICAGDGRALAAAVTATVPRTVSETAPFRVRLAGVPEEHDGESAFVFEVAFNKRPGADYSYTTMRDSTLKVRRGGETLTATRAKRLNAPHNDRWAITVAPGSKADLTVSIGPFAACTDAGAVCTADNEVLANAVSKTVLGPPGLSVADARVYEAAGATVDFAVTLGRAARETVTVDYATADGPSEGGAVAGEDYTAASGTLTFVAGETAKTVSVPVLNDAHDEGEETFTLTLSNPSGGNAWLEDATATGTIENTDAMPRAWLARFGRTVAEQVLDAVEGRLGAAPRPGIEVSLAGQAIGPGSGSGAGSAPEPEDEEVRKAAAADAAARDRLEAMTEWLQGGTERDGEDGRRAGVESRAVTGRDLLLGSSFALTAEAQAGGLVSLWGRGAVSRFDGREGDLILDGEVTSAMLGADWTRDVWTAGLLVSRSEGTGSYRGEGEGKVASTLTGLFPYGRYMVSDRVTLWGAAGYGEGTLTLTPKSPETGEDDRPIEAGMDLAMGAVGVRGVVVEAGTQGGMELAVKSDALAVRTSSEKTAGLAAATADVTRVRLGLEGTWRGIEAGGGALTPRLEVGVRHDGGDAETGFGLDLGGGLAWSHPASGVSAEVSGRGLLTHESRGFRDRGLSGSFAWDPGQGSGRGPKLTLSQTVGASASGGMDALLGRGTLAGLAANDDGDALENRRLELRLGYGFAAFGDRFTATPELGLGLGQGHREYTLGWRLGLEQSGPNALELRLEATRREAANDDTDPEHGIGLRLSVRW